MHPNDLTRDVLSRIVGYRVNNVELFQRSFTHKSALSASVATAHYETLEFMGDSVLGFIITKFIFDKFHNEKEGFLTKARTRLVRGKTLANVSKHLGLHNYILMEPVAMQKKWYMNANVLEDVFEALVGAVYMDAGMLTTRKFVIDTFHSMRLFDDEFIRDDDNYKDVLMRSCQKIKFPLPEYTARVTNGDHQVIVEVNKVLLGHGRGQSKREAEQNAAQTALYNWHTLNVGPSQLKTR